MATATTKSPGLSKSNSFTPLTTTLADGTEVVIVLQGVALPRKVSLEIDGDAEITIKHRYATDGQWWTEGVFTALNDDQDLQLTISDPIQAVSIQRTDGTNATSKVLIS